MGTLREHQNEMLKLQVMEHECIFGRHLNSVQGQHNNQEA